MDVPRSLPDAAVYYNHISISPLDDKHIFSYNIGYRRSRDGGKNFNVPGGGGNGGHCWHAMWHDPHNKNRYYIGSDGGLNLTHDDGVTDIRFENLNVTQHYTVSADNREPYLRGVAGCRTPAARAAPRPPARRASTCTSGSTSQAVTGITRNRTRRTIEISTPESQPDRQGGNIGRSDAETRQRTNLRPNKSNITNWDDYITPEMEKKAEAANWGCSRCRWDRSASTGRRRSSSRPNPKAIAIGSNHLIASLNGGQFPTA